MDLLTYEDVQLTYHGADLFYGHLLPDWPAVHIEGRWPDVLTPDVRLLRWPTVRVTQGDTLVVVATIPPADNPPSTGELTGRQFKLGDIVRSGGDVDVSDTAEGGLVVSVPLSVEDTLAVPLWAATAGQIRLEAAGSEAMTVAQFQLVTSRRNTNGV